MRKFKKAYIEITNQCNLSCNFCPKTKRKPKVMSVEEFTLVVDKLNPFTQHFYLHIMGEPLSHPDFGNILSICNEKNIQVNITTNGTLIGKQQENMLRYKPRLVCVSLHSFESNSIDKSLQVYLDNIIEFCNNASKIGIIIELRLWTMDRKSLNEKESLNYSIIQYLQEKLNLDFDLANAMYDKLDDSQKDNRRKRNIKLKEDIYLGMATKFNWPDIELYKGGTCSGFCYGLRNQIGVLADGQVVPCCLDSEGNINLGNLFVQSLDEILNSQKAKSLYDGFTERTAVEPLCNTCGYMKQYFKQS